MTYSEASTIVRAQFDKTNAQLNRIDWVKVRSFLYNIAYNIAVFVGVVVYLGYLAVRTTIKAIRIAHSMWVEYEVTAKIEGAITTLRSEVPLIFDKARKQVEKVYADFGNRVQKIVSAMANDYRSIRNEVRAITKD